MPSSKWLHTVRAKVKMRKTWFHQNCVVITCISSFVFMSATGCASQHRPAASEPAFEADARFGQLPSEDRFKYFIPLLNSCDVDAHLHRGSPMIVRVSVENVGKEPRDYWAPLGIQIPDFDLYVLQNGTDHWLPLHNHSHIPPWLILDNKYWIEFSGGSGGNYKLNPGEKKTESIDISRWFNFDSPGEFTVFICGPMERGFLATAHFKVD